MTKQPQYATLLLLALTGILWGACTQQRQPCLTPRIASLIVESTHFLTDTSTVAVDTAFPYAVFVPLPVSGKLNGGIYRKQSLFTLSLSPDSTICKWGFTSDSLTNKLDTITFHYKRNLQFLSNACGYTYFYTLQYTETTHLFIDSIHILNPSVTNNVQTKHLQIYIHPGF
jgi:hypothetical protein